MDLPAICRLPVAALAAPDAVLAIWVNAADIEATVRVIKAWGFRAPYEGTHWVKLTRAGKFRMGLGHSTRKTGENQWLAPRGRGLPRFDKGVASGFAAEAADVIASQRRENSRKPDEAYRKLERLYGEVRRIELFGRRERKGWTLWGNEVLPPDAAPMLPFDDGALDEELAT
jgi:N6-adenosine-specific RNA methylase IME4